MPKQETVALWQIDSSLTSSSHRQGLTEEQLKDLRDVLSRGVGSGQTTVRHAQEVGAILGDEVFNQPGQTEARVHNSAIRKAEALPCEIQWLQIPLCTGYNEEDEPIITMKEWPFILPHLLVQSMVDAGYLKLLIDFDIAEDYWTHMLKDFPGHPAGASATTSIPLTLYGDEGQALGDSYMSFHFQPDLSPWLSNAGVSRFLITTIPSNMYVFNQDGINLTLQSAAAIIVESMNKLSTSGVDVRDVQSDEVLTMRCFVMSFKGDWKYLIQLFNMTNTPSKEQVCWMCKASKGSRGDLENCYVNLDPQASWRSTIGQDSPWQHQPEYSKLIGFDPLMISIDPMHCWHLGTGRDVVASAIKYLVLKRFWPGRNQEHQLACCSKRLLRYAKAHRLPLRLRKLTKSNLGWSTGTCPELHCKAFDTYVVLRFLVSEVTSRDCGDPDLATMLWAADSFLTLLHKSGHFLTPEEQEHRVVVGELFLKVYTKLAAKAVAGKKNFGAQGRSFTCYGTWCSRNAVVEVTRSWVPVGWMKMP